MSVFSVIAPSMVLYNGHNLLEIVQTIQIVQTRPIWEKLHIFVNNGLYELSFKLWIVHCDAPTHREARPRGSVWCTVLTVQQVGALVVTSPEGGGTPLIRWASLYKAFGCGRYRTRHPWVAAARPKCRGQAGPWAR